MPQEDNRKIPKKNSSHVQSVERALILLDTLAEENRELTLTELAGLLGWPKSTVHGLLSTLRDYHYIDQSPVTGRYRLGVRLFELGSLVGNTWDVRTAAIPEMQRLNARFGEMVQLATEDRGEVLYLDKMDSTRMMRIVSDIGGRLPMHCTGLGKVLLAHKALPEVRSIITRKGMRSYTHKTITSLPVLERELAKIQTQGWGMDDREIMESLRCVAAPIFDREGRCRYAVSVSGLYNNMQNDRLEEIVDYLKATAMNISFALGYRE